MKSSGIFETKNHLSEICEQVAKSGEPLVVTRHGKPLVRIVPMENVYDQQSVWDTVQESQAKYGPLPDDFEIPERNTSFNHSDPLSEPFGAED